MSEESELKKLIVDILEEQKKIVKTLEEQAEKLDKIEQYIKNIELEGRRTKLELSPAMFKLLKKLADTESWMTPEEVAESAGVSKNLTPRYLRMLYRMGLVLKQPNPDRRRYKASRVYKINVRGLPEEIRNLLHIHKTSKEQTSSKSSLEKTKEPFLFGLEYSLIRRLLLNTSEVLTMLNSVQTTFS